MSHLPLKTLLAVLALSSGTTAHAQAWGPMAPGYLAAPTQLWALDTVDGADEAPEPPARRIAKQNGIATSERESLAATVAKLDALTRFTPSPARRQANIRAFLARVSAQDPRGGAQLEAEFRTNDIFAKIDQVIAPHGMSANNVADTFALWWITTWEASQGITDGTEDPQTLKAVRQQALLSLLATPGFAKFSDARKQEMADEYILTATAIGTSLSYFAQNPAGLPAFQSDMKRTTRAAGMDLDSMRLTKAGFVPKR